MNKVLILLGPTGIGKSNVAIELAKLFNGEIISVDSVQVYKDFDIGSAKVTEEEKQNIVHYGIDILKPNDYFNAFEFVSYTKNVINDISLKGHLPIIVGGTGLYIKALVENYNLGGIERHEEYRKFLEDKIDKEGLESVYKMLLDLDKSMALKIDKNNKLRIIRALEIIKFGGEKNISSSITANDYKIFALNMDRKLLYERINQRVIKMIDNGLIEEVKKILVNYDKNIPPLRAIGYKEVIEYLDGSISKDKMIELIQQHSRNYAKRQLTFLKTISNVNYINIDNYFIGFEQLTKEIEKWLKS